MPGEINILREQGDLFRPVKLTEEEQRTVKAQQEAEKKQKDKK